MAVFDTIHDQKKCKTIAEAWYVNSAYEKPNITPSYNIFSSTFNSIARLDTYNASRKPEFYLSPALFPIDSMRAIDTNLPISGFPTSLTEIKNLEGTYV